MTEEKGQMVFLRKILSNEIFLITLFYSLASGITLFNNGIYWDDWIFYQAAKPLIMDVQRECGRPWFGYYLVFIFSFKSLILPRLIVFSLFLLSALFLNSILKDIKEIDNPSRLIIVLLFALFPVNFARVILCASQYPFCLFAMFSGLWLFARFLKNNKIILRYSSLFILSISFFTESILIFYLALLSLLILYKERKSIHSFIGLLPRLIKYADFLLLPFAFWLVKTAFFKPWGHYIEYNHISLRFIVAAPIWLVWAFNEAFICVMNNVFSVFLSNICLSIISGFIIFLLIPKIVRSEEENVKYDLKLFYLGLFLFSVAVFPYIVTGSMPNLYDWNSRFQLLVPLGACFILYYGIRSLSNRLGWRYRWYSFLYAMIIAIFIAVNFTTYLNYQKDWYKQLSLVELFKSSRIIQDNTTFIFDDQTRGMNAQKRVYRFYEYAGLMKFALKDETRFGVDLDFYNKVKWGKFFVDQPRHNISGYVPKDPDYRVVIKTGHYDLSRSYQVIRVIYYEVFFPKKFKEVITGIVKLEYVKL